MLLVPVVAERDDEADSDKPEEDEEVTLSEALVAVRYVPEPESVFEFELDVDDVNEVEEDELAHASGSVKCNSEPSSSAHSVTIVAQLDSLVIHSASESVEVAHDMSDEFEYDAQLQLDSEILKRGVGNEASSVRSCCAAGSGGTGTSASHLQGRLEYDLGCGLTKSATIARIANSPSRERAPLLLFLIAPVLVFALRIPLQHAPMPMPARQRL